MLLIPIKKLILSPNDFKRPEILSLNEQMLSTEDKLGLGMKIFTPGQLPSQNLYDINKRKHDMIHRNGVMGMSSMQSSHASNLKLTPMELAQTQNDLSFYNSLNPNKTQVQR